MKEVRGKLMALMKKHQMDTTEFSEKCGIKEERVERLLGGRGKPSHLERMCIAEAFGMTEEELQDIEPLSQTEVREVQTDGIEKVIAERCGLKRQRAKKLMNGEVKMSIAEAVSIANEFQVSLEYLLGRYPYPLPAPQTEEEWMVYEKLGQMDENEAQKYLEMMMPMKKGLS